MSKKPIRFGIKVWIMADAIFKYLWNFEVYYGMHSNPCEEEVTSDEEIFTSGVIERMEHLLIEKEKVFRAGMW
jgi:hypothetical protein